MPLVIIVGHSGTKKEALRNLLVKAMLESDSDLAFSRDFGESNESCFEEHSWNAEFLQSTVSSRNVSIITHNPVRKLPKVVLDLCRPKRKSKRKV